MARRTPSPDELKISPEVHWFLLDRKIGLPTCVPAVVTPEPRRVRGAEFDAEKVDKVLDVFAKLRHTKGPRWAGKPLTPDPWETAYVIAPTFGWVSYDSEAGRSVRIIRKLYLDVPRKNGKSTLAGGLGLYLTCADGEDGAEVITAATTKDQAGFVFNPIKRLAELSPELKQHVKAFAGRVNHVPTDSYIQVVASAASAQHGANLHAGIVDELHLHDSPDLVEAIETSTGSRDQPLIIYITTADDGRQVTIYAIKREYCEKIAAGVIKDPAFRGIIFAAPEHLDPFSVEAQKAANPGYGKSPTARYLQDAATQAQNSPAEKASYLRLHLGIRTKQATRYIELDVWDRNASIVLEDDFKRRDAFGGMDLATTTDLCAVCWLFPDGKGGVDAIWRHWIPERGFERLNDRTARTAEVWRERGLLTVTPGDVADYDYIEEQINRDRETFNVKSIGYDPWNASQMVNNLVAKGAPMVKLGQNVGTLSAPLKQIKHMLNAGTAEKPLFRHGGNPLMRWQADNLAVVIDPNENVKPNKEKSGDKIDGFVAAVDAMAEVMAAGAHLPVPPQVLPRQARTPTRSHVAGVMTQGF